MQQPEIIFSTDDLTGYIAACPITNCHWVSEPQPMKGHAKLRYWAHLETHELELS